MTLLWAHSGDSHFLEPEGLWKEILPPALAARMPRSEQVGDDEEIVHVDGKSFRRRLPSIMTKKDKDGLTITELATGRPARATFTLGSTTWTRRASGARSCTRRSDCGKR